MMALGPGRYPEAMSQPFRKSAHPACVATNPPRHPGERRKAHPPSDALLARVCAVIDLLIASGLSEEIATQTMVQRMIAAGVPVPESEEADNWWKSMLAWKAAFRNGAATDDTLKEYQNVLEAIDSLPLHERVELVLGNELWDRRHLDLHRPSARGCPIY